MVKTLLSSRISKQQTVAFIREEDWSLPLRGHTALRLSAARTTAGWSTLSITMELITALSIISNEHRVGNLKRRSCCRIVFYMVLRSLEAVSTTVYCFASTPPGGITKCCIILPMPTDHSL